MRAARRFINRSVQPIIGTIMRVETADPLIALTFDDGPHPVHTPALLDLLDRHGARATFFVIGERAAAHPDIIARQIASGHAVANHTWNHDGFVQLSGADRRRQVKACAAITRVSARLFRPPQGRQTLASRLDIWRCGHDVITWDLDTMDWRDRDAGTLASRIEQGARPGSIVLMHDAIWDGGEESADRRPTLDAVDRVLTRLKDRYRFVTVPALLAAGTPVRVNWFDRAS